VAISTRPDYEDELVRRAAANAQDAWTEIYERHHSKLFRYVQARVGDRQTAEDLTATVFLEALKSIRGYRSRGRPLLAWLYTIARNVVNYHYRSHFRKQAPGPLGRFLSRGMDDDDRLQVRAETVAPAADPAAAVEGWDLRDAVNRLSPEQREVVILRYFVGLTTPEVARLLAKHERAVYSLQTRAIQSLRRQLQ
jgi:RNA polymerase sigma-70 factor (ECF subfamily)